MATIYVRLTGNDSTGTGAYDNPYLTIAKGVSVASLNDTVDVGAGLFLETVISSITIPIYLRGVVGQTRWQSATLTGATPSMMTFTSALSSVPGTVTVSGFMLEPQMPGFDSISLIQGVPAGAIFFARNIFRFTGNEFGVKRVDSDSQYVVLLNNTLVSQVPGQSAGRAIADLNSPLFRLPTVAVNNIFQNLKVVVDDQVGQRGIVSNWNVFDSNDRDFRFGTYGRGDFQADPKFTNPALLDYSLTLGSPCINAGFNVSNFNVPVSTDLELNPSLPFGDGTVRDGLVPTSALNWGSFQSSLDIGALEYPVSDTKRQVNNFVIHTIMAAFASELDVINSLSEYIKAGRTLSGADVLQLQQRWGQFMGVVRPVGFSRNDYEEFIRTLLTSFQQTPAIGSIEHFLADLLLNQSTRVEYFKSPRWRLGTALKITVPDPIGNPTQAHVTAGKFQLLNQWWTFDAQTLTLGNGVWLLYAAPFDASLLTNDKPTLLSVAAGSDEILPPMVDYFYTMNVRLFANSTSVARVSSTPLFTSLQPGYVMQINGYNYRIAEIGDAGDLTLSEPWLGDDQILSVNIGFPQYPFGFVTVVNGAITRVCAHSRLGYTAFADSSTSRAHTYQLQVGGMQNATMYASSEAEDQLFGLLSKMVPVHKLCLASFQDDAGRGRILNPNTPTIINFSTPFTELFNDVTFNQTL